MLQSPVRIPVSILLAAALGAGCSHTEASVREQAIEKHELAGRSKDPSSYRSAKEGFEAYLAEYGKSQYAAKMRFRYADVLAFLGEHAKAAPLYDGVADKSSSLEPDLRRDAAAKAIRSWEQVVPEDAVYRSDAARRLMKIDLKRNYDEREIPADEKKLAMAYDRYVEVSDPDKDRLSGIRFGEAYIYYRHNHFTESAERFASIVSRWPRNEFARRATSLMFDSLRLRNDWVALDKYAREFVVNDEFTRGDRKFVAQLKELVEGAAMNAAMAFDAKARANSDPVASLKGRKKASMMLKKLQKEFPKSRFADQMLFNAALVLWGTEAYDEAAGVYRQMLNRYPKSKLSKRAKVALNKVIVQADQCFSDEDVPDAEDSDAYWKNCLELEFDEEWAEVANCWEGLTSVHPGASLERRMRSQVRRAIALRKIGEAKAAKNELEHVVTRFDERDKGADGQRRMRNSAAWAAFLLLDGQMERYRRMKVTDNPSTVIRKMIKAKALAKAKGSTYARLGNKFGDPCYAAAAHARRAEIWLDVADGIRQAPAPRGLSQDQRMIYRSEQAEQAGQVEKNARAAAGAALDTAAKARLANRWTALAKHIIRTLDAR